MAFIFLSFVEMLDLRLGPVTLDFRLIVSPHSHVIQHHSSTAVAPSHPKTSLVTTDQRPE